jgi:hypothetical protein
MPQQLPDRAQDRGTAPARRHPSAIPPAARCAAPAPSRVRGRPDKALRSGRRRIPSRRRPRAGPSRHIETWNRPWSPGWPPPRDRRSVPRPRRTAGRSPGGPSRTGRSSRAWPRWPGARGTAAPGHPPHRVRDRRSTPTGGQVPVPCRPPGPGPVVRQFRIVLEEGQVETPAPEERELDPGTAPDRDRPAAPGKGTDLGRQDRRHHEVGRPLGLVDVRRGRARQAFTIGCPARSHGRPSGGGVSRARPASGGTGHSASNHRHQAWAVPTSVCSQER